MLGWHDANSDLRRSAEGWTIECNRRNRPTPQSLPGLLAQALEESIFHHIELLSEASVHDRCRSRAPLLDYLVGEGEQLVWNLEAERLGGLEVDHEVEFDRLYDRKVGRLGAFENFAGVDADLMIRGGDARSVTD